MVNFQAPFVSAVELRTAAGLSGNLRHIKPEQFKGPSLGYLGMALALMRRCGDGTKWEPDPNHPLAIALFREISRPRTQ
jgi:hypothetical protein